MEFALQHPTDIDVDELVELYRASDRIDAPGGATSDREDVVWRWRIGEFDRGRDAWVARCDGRLVAYAWVFEGLADVRVHPDARGRGLGGGSWT